MSFLRSITASEDVRQAADLFLAEQGLDASGSEGEAVGTKLQGRKLCSDGDIMKETAERSLGALGLKGRTEFVSFTNENGFLQGKLHFTSQEGRQLDIVGSVRHRKSPSVSNVNVNFYSDGQLVGDRMLHFQSTLGPRLSRNWSWMHTKEPELIKNISQALKAQELKAQSPDPAPAPALDPSRPSLSSIEEIGTTPGPAEPRHELEPRVEL